MREEVIALPEKLSRGSDPKASEGKIDPEPPKCGCGSEADVPTEASSKAGADKSDKAGETNATPTKMALPSLPKFGGNKPDGDAFDRWVQRLLCHAELECWTDQQELLQFELHLSGKAEQTVRGIASGVHFCIGHWVSKGEAHPVQNQALLSAQLMKRKQPSQSTSTHRTWRPCSRRAMGVGQGWTLHLKNF